MFDNLDLKYYFLVYLIKLELVKRVSVIELMLKMVLDLVIFLDDYNCIMYCYWLWQLVVDVQTL